jgi:hypothetical protein
LYVKPRSLQSVQTPVEHPSEQLAAFAPLHRGDPFDAPASVEALETAVETGAAS